MTVAVGRPLVVDDVDLVVRAALDGVGLAFVAEQHAEPHLSEGARCACPSRRQQPAALSALIDTLRLEADRRK